MPSSSASAFLPICPPLAEAPDPPSVNGVKGLTNVYVAHVLARPDKRLAYTNPWILSYPCSHDEEVFSTFQWDYLASLFVSEVAALVIQVTIKSHIGTTTDGQ